MKYKDDNKEDDNGLFKIYEIFYKHNFTLTGKTNYITRTYNIY